MKTRKSASITAAIVLFALCLAACGNAAAAEKSFTVTVTHADGSQKTFSYTAAEETVGAALAAEGLIAGETGAYGLYVTTVDGEIADYDENGCYWAFYIDGEYAQYGVDQTELTDGAAYQFVYTGMEETGG